MEKRIEEGMSKFSNSHTKDIVEYTLELNEWENCSRPVVCLRAVPAVW